MTLLKRVFPLLIFAALPLTGTGLFPAPVQALDTGACHCFRHRKYDPENRFAADDYLLATSFNSLTAAYFSISKKQLIRYKMKGGVTRDDLLIALDLARTGRLETAELLRARTREGSWKKTISTFPALTDDNHRNRLLACLRSAHPAAWCATDLINRMISNFYNLTSAELDTARCRGLDSKELALLFFLVRTRKIPPGKLIEQVKEEGRSWSEASFFLGLTPKKIGRGILKYENERW